MTNNIRTLGKRFLALCPGVYDYFKGRKVKAKLLAEANEKFADPDFVMPPGASREDYEAALNKHLVSFREYMYSFEFWKKSEAERDAIISREATHLLQFRLRLAFPDYDNPALFWNKEKFLAEMQRLGLNHRRWLYSPDATREQISELLHATDCIIKKHDSACGLGIYKTHHDNENEISEAIADCRIGKNVVEQCIDGYSELQAFNPSSLNTLRIVTISHDDKSMVFRSGFRMGRINAIADNTQAGGLYATIDPITGIIPGEALDYTGKTYSAHPDSGKQITGYQIPKWDLIIDTCNRAAIAIKGITIIGWDVCLTADGEVEFIEANHSPDFSGDKHHLLNSIEQITGKRFKA